MLFRSQKIRDGKFGKLPNDKLVTAAANNQVANSVIDVSDEEIPF